MPQDRKTLVLLDSHAIIHRAYHALPDFSSSKGEPTGALYGLANMLMKIVSDLKPDYIIACYDLPGKTFRHEVYDGYKGKRAKTDDALVVQLQKSREIFEAFNIPIYDAPGFEADDVLGTIVHKVLEDKKFKDINIIIASGDMDTMQLVEGDRVKIFTLKKGITDTIIYDEDAVLERFGFKPKLLPDYKGLRGDTSDNIIGIKGIGEKTATTLIQQFGTIEDIYKKIKKDPSAFDELISPRIFELIKDNEEEAVFSKTLAKIRHDAPIDFSLPEKTFWANIDPNKVENTFQKFEFRSLISRLKNFFGKNGAESLTKSLISEDMIASNYDPVLIEEATIMLWLLNSDLNNIKVSDILAFAKTKDFNHALEYLKSELKNKGMVGIWEEIEKPIMPIVRQMEIHGIKIDRKFFHELSLNYHKDLDSLITQIYKLAGVEFNINSPKQLGEVLFEKMNIKSKGRKTAGGARSTKIEVLEELEDGNPIISLIMKYRELQKLLSTYVDVIPTLADSSDRLHAKFLQYGASTGRFSSQNPNLQNLPIKTDLGKKIRGGFIADTNHKLSAFDYSQIELRVIAILSGDEKMLEIFRSGKDIHAGVASFVFGVPIDKVDGEMRRKAKVINFGIIYGMGVNSLRKNLGGTREEAQKFYDNYFNQFSGVKKYLEETKNFAVKNGFTETLFGRRRYFPNIKSRIPFLRAMAERTATNAPVQGTAADIIKLAIRFVNEDLEKNKLSSKVHLILQIHDELVYEIQNDVLSKAEQIIKNAMEGVFERSFLKLEANVPLLVNYGSGVNLENVK